MEEHQLELFDRLKYQLETGRWSRREFLRAASTVGLATMASAFLSACRATPAPTAVPTVAPTAVPPTATPIPGPTGKVRFLVTESFWSDWNLYQTAAGSMGRLSSQIWDTLLEIRTNDFGNITPGLATGYKILDDVTWEFTLREGVKFHDGQEFTAEDVKATIEYCTGAAGVETVSSQFWVPTKVEVIDKYKCRLITSTPFAPLLNNAALTAIACAADILREPEGKALNARPNGTGPFRLVGDEKDIKTVEAFEGHWRKGLPKIKTLINEWVQDGQTRLNALLAGQCEVIDRLAPEDLVQLEGRTDIKVISSPRLENVNLWMRQGIGAPWNNPNLRKAFAWCIDRDAIVENLVKGSSQVSKCHIPNLAAYAVEQTPKYTYNKDKMMESLRAAGFNSPSEVPEFELCYSTGFLPRSKEVAEFMIDSFQKEGFKVKGWSGDITALIDYLHTDVKNGYMFHLSWGSSGDPHSAMYLYRPGSPYGFDDQKVEDLIVKGYETVRPEERAKVYAELLKYLWDNVIHLPLYNSSLDMAHRANLHDLIALANGRQYFERVYLS